LPGKVLDIFVQPADWDGDEEQRPLQKLAVTIEHKLDGEPTRAANAMRAIDEKCKSSYGRLCDTTLLTLNISRDGRLPGFSRCDSRMGDQGGLQVLHATQKACSHPAI